MTAKLITLAAAIALTACVGRPAKIETVEVPSARVIAAGASAKSVQLFNIVVDVDAGKHMGQRQYGPLCMPESNLNWRLGRGNFNASDLSAAFRDELTKANYPVVGNGASMFEDTAQWRGDLVVGARITSVEGNICYLWRRVDDSKGEMGLTVEWQIYNRTERRVVHTVTVRGTAHLNEYTAEGMAVLFRMAFAAATRILANDATFHGLVAGGDRKTNRAKASAEPPPSVLPSFELRARLPYGGPIVQHMKDVQAAVVTVLIDGGHGSGFLISSDGYVLTNAHVAEDETALKLRLASGREVMAEVIARNHRRDVALLRISELGLPALPIAASEPAVGSDVYALGSPMYESLATTVTRGIVGGYRTSDQMRWLQSDVVIQTGNSGGPLTDASGNVVGIASRGLQTGTGASMGLNFFIPIADALKGIAIARGELQAVSRMVRLEEPIAAVLRPGRPPEATHPQVAAPPAPAVPATPPAAPPVPSTGSNPDEKTSQVAAAAVTTGPERRDGDYRTRFTATTLSGQSYVDLAINIDGGTIRGTGRTRGGLQCRANGELAPDGTAWINVACSNAGSAYLSWQLAGRFAAEKDGTAYVGRLAYANLNGAPGEAVFRQ